MEGAALGGDDNYEAEFTWVAFFCCLTAASGGALFGYDNGEHLRQLDLLRCRMHGRLEGLSAFGRPDLESLRGTLRVSARRCDGRCDFHGRFSG